MLILKKYNNNTEETKDNHDLKKQPSSNRL